MPPCRAAYFPARELAVFLKGSRRTAEGFRPGVGQHHHKHHIAYEDVLLLYNWSAPAGAHAIRPFLSRVTRPRRDMRRTPARCCIPEVGAAAGRLDNRYAGRWGGLGHWQGEVPYSLPIRCGRGPIGTSDLAYCTLLCV